MATRREQGASRVVRRNENSSPYKRRAPEPKLQSSSSLSSFLSFLSNPFRRRSSASVPSPPASDHSEAEGETEAEDDDEGEPELGVKQRGRMVERENPAAETLSRLGRTLQQTLPKPPIPPSVFPSADAPPVQEMKSSATTSHLAPPTRARRSVQPSFATVSRAGGRRAGRPSFPGGYGSYGGFSATAEPSPPPFTPSNPLETSFAANRPSASTSQFSFTAPKPTIETAGLPGKTNSEILAEFFAAKGKTPLTAEEKKKVAKLIAESDAESQSPDADPYNGVPSFSFLKASFPVPQRDSLSPSNSLTASESAPSTSGGLSFNFGSSSREFTQPTTTAPSVAPRKRRPINYGGPSKRSAAITKAGFTLREHQKLLERQKARQENVAPDTSLVGDKRGARDTDEEGGGKRRKANDGQVAAEEPKTLNGLGRVLSLSAQPSMPSPLRQMTKLNSPSPPRVVLRAQAPSPSSPLSRPVSEESPASAKTTTATKVKPRTSLVADVMRDMLAEDKAREKKEQAKEKPADPAVFANPYEDGVHQPIVPKVRKPRRTSARPASKSSATVAKQEERPLSLIEKIEQTDVRPSAKKAKTSPEPPVLKPPTLTFTAPSPKETKPKARRPCPIVEEPTIPGSTESDEIEIIDMDDEPKSKPAPKPSLSVDVTSKQSDLGNNKPSGMLGLPGRQRPSFSLHSPARPSPLREMSVPIEDEEEEIVEIPSPDKGSGFGGFGSSSTFGSGSASGFGSSSSFGSGVSFGSTSGFGATANSNGMGSTNGSTLHSFGFSSVGAFSAPIPPPAPILAPAQLPAAKKEAPKIDAPLFAPKAAEPEPKIAKAEPPKEVTAPKPIVVAQAQPVVATPALPPVVSAPAPLPAAIPPVPTPAAKSLSETDLKYSAKSLPIASLPKFSFTVAVPSKLVETHESKAAAALPVASLPTFTFASSAPAPAKTPSFDWGAAGIKAPTASGSTWMCGTCSLSNPASATDKCTICDAPRTKTATIAPTPAPAPVPAKTASFDWGAAGLKAPTTASGSMWTCATCSLSNPASATEKCTICEAPKPGASAPAPSPTPAPVTKTTSFNWAAAGMTAPTTTGWTCGTCGLSNPSTAAKCTICDAAR